jgi:hypothetical protein
MFAEVEKYVPLDWAITVLPFGPRALPAVVEDAAKRLAQYSTTYDDINIGRMLRRANQQPILIEKTLAKEEVAPIKKQSATSRYRIYAVCGISRLSASQPDANRPTLVARGWIGLSPSPSTRTSLISPAWSWMKRCSRGTIRSAISSRMLSATSAR